VSSASDLYFGFFFLLSLLFYLHLSKKEKTNKTLYLLSVAAYMLGMMSKETAIVLPALLVVFDISHKGLGWTIRRAPRYLPYAAVGVAYLVMRSIVIGGFIHQEQVELTAWGVVLNVFPLFAGYLKTLLFPMELSAIYVFHPVALVTDPTAAVGIIVAIAFVVLIFLARKKPVELLCLFLIAVPLLPVLYIPALQLSPFAERYLYIPSAGFAVLSACVLSRLARAGEARGISGSRAVVTLFAALMVATYAYGTVDRSAVWKDDLSLWKDTVVKAPDSHNAHYNLAWAYQRAGENEKAAAHYIETIRIKPERPKAHYNLALIYQASGDTARAIESYEAAIRYNPTDARAHYNLALAYQKEGGTRRALEHYVAAVNARPDFEDAHFNLAWTYLSAGLPDNAIIHFREVIRINPASADAWYNLGLSYANKGIFDRAAAALEEALKIFPGHTEARVLIERIRSREGGRGNN
jgi:tetratricopeptide (TPR) repeat protein